jgi:hypothetical protein
MKEATNRIEFGDFQTPLSLARDVCDLLLKEGVDPDFIVEPTCGVGAFLIAAQEKFQCAQGIHGFELNPSYVAKFHEHASPSLAKVVDCTTQNFFTVDWTTYLEYQTPGRLLILGNLPWVTNSGLGQLGSDNLPRKHNFQAHIGLAALTGAANFDISESMLITLAQALKKRSAHLALLVKTAVARKFLKTVRDQQLAVSAAYLAKIDAKLHFNASVDACLLYVQFVNQPTDQLTNYVVYESLDKTTGKTVVMQNDGVIADWDAYQKFSYALGVSPQKWRSGIKHDAAPLMELKRQSDGTFLNGLGEQIEIEQTYLYPMLKGSEVANAKPWVDRWMLVPQQFCGENTNHIEAIAPKTWQYLTRHSMVFENRKSSIYRNKPQFSVFGVGDYTFKPWRIAICGMYKKLAFHLLGPTDGKPLVFDDTVYYIAFDNQAEAQRVLDCLASEVGSSVLSSLIFWEDKRPIKTALLNRFDWSLVDKSLSSTTEQHFFEFV